MKKISYRFLFPFLLIVLLIISFSRSIFIVPPIGKLLNPYTGAIQNERENKDVNGIQINACRDSIEIYFDERAVPHIFAKNDYDMYLAQGYITAKDRLWQMDFITYVAAGRLAELFGENFLPNDRLQRRMGILTASERTLKYIESNPETKLALDAFTTGVNEYIQSLNYKDYPFEYKLMDYRPEPWTNLKSVLIMKNLASILTGYDEDLYMSHLFLALGKTEFKKLYPECALQDSISLKVTELLVNNALPYSEYLNYGFLSSKADVVPSQYNPRLGSNNWAISGVKSKTGHPVLCNDPHLNLSLPGVWYEIQLASNTTNVYGVSVPGTIGVIIGFNEKIAWGMTNGSTDVKDWYKIQIKDDYSQYQMDNKWEQMSKEIQEIKIKDKPSFFDTIYSTIHGPIVMDNNFSQNVEMKNLALKWVMHQPTNEMLTFIHLNKAKNYEAFKEAISHYKCPSQNFVFASSSDTIAIHHQGLFYEKWNGQGRFILDGTKRSHLYSKEILNSQLPQTVNPSSEFVYSANNFPLFDSLPGYMNGYYMESRALRIKKVLESQSHLSIEDMQKLQLDNTNEIARLVKPELLKNMNQNIAKNKKEKQLIEALKKWEGNFDDTSVEAYFFSEWWKAINSLTWDELRNQSHYFKDPDPMILYKLLRDEKQSVYFDKVNTDKKETAKEIIAEAFEKTIANFSYKSWGEINQVNIMHLSKIEALSKMKMNSSGNPEAVNAISETWGPSWRMIVEMGERPKAYGVFVGGQSGNPASLHYDDFISDWKNGKYYELKFFLDKKEAKQAIHNPFCIFK